MFRQTAIAVAIMGTLAGCAGGPFEGLLQSRPSDHVEGKPESGKVNALVRVADATAATGDWNAWDWVGADAEPASPGVCTMATNGSECTPCLSHGITALQSTKSGTIAAIDELTSPTGTTNITQGLGWAWRVVKPEAPYTEADPDPDGPRQQAIVLLTDGENFAGNGDGYKTVFGYGSAGRDDMDDRLRALATNVKASGVKIYTIQFANSGGPLEALMKEIASGPDAPYYHYAPDPGTLQTVFQGVANHLSELRLSK